LIGVISLEDRQNALQTSKKVARTGHGDQTGGRSRLTINKGADERTRTTELLIASEKWEVAGHCGHLLWLAESSYLSRIFFTGLHTIAQYCALGDVEVMYIDVCGVRISSGAGALHTSNKPLCLDRYSPWMPSMGCNTTDEIEGALG
jgi:hypothetical protein